MKSNLTPTVVTDKNGRTTTVHKKLATAPTTAKTLPAPTITAPKAAPAKIETRDTEISARLFTLMEAANGRDIGMNKFVFAARSNNRQMKLYVDLLERNDGFWDIINAATSNGMGSRQPSKSEVESIALIYDKDSYTRFPNEPKAGKARKQHLKLAGYRDALAGAYREPAIKGIKTHKESIRLADLPAETVHEVREYAKILSVVKEVLPEEERSFSDLLDVALHGEHSVDDVINVIREHHTVDANVVLGVLNGSSPAVAQGWL